MLKRDWTFWGLPVLAVAALLGAVLTAHADKGGTPQASITLGNNDAKYCYKHDNNWTLEKSVTGNTVVDGSGTVTWTITATKSSGDTTFTVYGGLTITNTGSAPATIGNIVVNLQKPNNTKIAGKLVPWVSVAADVATATSGDAATSANIVASASAEGAAFNAAFGAGNYSVVSPKGKFTETAGSGSLEFTDASNNTVFSMVPQPVIPVGASVTLLYQADFSSTLIASLAGQPLRVEALVTFGNAGSRGGSGSTASNIDINGNGTIDADEALVRTVASRVTMPAVPAAPEECNDSVALADAGPSTTGTVTAGNLVGFDTLPATISDSGSWEVSADVSAGETGGSVCNNVTLTGESDGGTLNVIVGYLDGGLDELGNQIWIPVYAEYTCCVGADLSDGACVDLSPGGPKFENGDYCTWSQGGYQGNGVPGQLFNNNFISVFSSTGGLTIGIDDAAGTKHHALWTATAAGQTALKSWLGGGGSSGPLTADTINATSTSGGTLAKQTAALTLSVRFNAAGITGNGLYTNLGDLEFCDMVDGVNILTTDTIFSVDITDASALNGKSISDVLADANTFLGGGGLPAYVDSAGDLNSLIAALNLSFHTCIVSEFALEHLCVPEAPVPAPPPEEPPAP